MATLESTPSSNDVCMVPSLNSVTAPTGWPRNLRLQRTDVDRRRRLRHREPALQRDGQASSRTEGFQRGYRVFVCGTNESPEKQSDLLAHARRRARRRCHLVAVRPGGVEIGELIDAGIPVVAIRPRGRGPSVPTPSSPTTLRAWPQATQLLIDAGHTEIAYIGGRKGVETSIERLKRLPAGDACRGAAITAVVGDFRIEGGRRAVAALLASPPIRRQRWSSATT